MAVRFDGLDGDGDDADVASVGLERSRCVSASVRAVERDDDAAVDVVSLRDDGASPAPSGCAGSAEGRPSSPPCSP